jgi:hypothetical protein
VRLSHIAIALVLGALPAAAHAGEDRTIDKSRHLWATVNICDTEKSPNTIGLRASMPGSGKKKERMFMRFRVQFKGADGVWKNFEAKGTISTWQPVGSARFKARQSGFTFPFEPDAGQRFELRGVVNYQWRQNGGKVVRRATKATSAGHNVSVADPEGYSAATCEIVG